MAGVKTNFFIFTVLALLVPHAAAAQVVFSEIMYDLPSGSDSGREWVEVHNIDATAVDITDFTLYENDTNHRIVPVSGGDTLAPGAYAVIADKPDKFLTDWPQYSGALFDSAFSLNNSGETLTLKNASSTLDSVLYVSAQGASGDGNSLNREDSGAWVARKPTPGAPLSSDAFQKPAPAPSVPKIAKETTPSSGAVDSLPITESTSTFAPPQTPQPVEVSSGTSPYLWWGSAAALALAAAAAIAVSRRMGKDEWDIIEDTSE